MYEGELFGSVVRIDEAVSAGWYAEAAEWGCGCGHCRNFVRLARAGALLAPVTETLEKLGIPPEKATYVCEIMPEEGGYLCQFSYRLAGEILEPGDRQGIGRCCHEPYPYGAPGFPGPHFDLEFRAVLPWTEEPVT